MQSVSMPSQQTGLQGCRAIITSTCPLLSILFYAPLFLATVAIASPTSSPISCLPTSVTATSRLLVEGVDEEQDVDRCRIVSHSLASNDPNSKGKWTPLTGDGAPVHSGWDDHYIVTVTANPRNNAKLGLAANMGTLSAITAIGADEDSEQGTYNNATDDCDQMFKWVPPFFGTKDVVFEATCGGDYYVKKSYPATYSNINERPCSQSPTETTCRNKNQDRCDLGSRPNLCAGCLVDHFEAKIFDANFGTSGASGFVTFRNPASNMNTFIDFSQLVPNSQVDSAYICFTNGNLLSAASGTFTVITASSDWCRKLTSSTTNRCSDIIKLVDFPDPTIKGGGVIGAQSHDFQTKKGLFGLDFASAVLILDKSGASVKCANIQSKRFRHDDHFGSICEPCPEHTSTKSSNRYSTKGVKDCKCKVRFYDTSATDTHKVTCKKCDISCFSCDGPTSSDCLSCDSSYWKNPKTGNCQAKALIQTTTLIYFKNETTRNFGTYVQKSFADAVLQSLNPPLNSQECMKNYPNQPFLSTVAGDFCLSKALRVNIIKGENATDIPYKVDLDKKVYYALKITYEVETGHLFAKDVLISIHNSVTNNKGLQVALNSNPAFLTNPETSLIAAPYIFNNYLMKGCTFDTGDVSGYDFVDGKFSIKWHPSHEKDDNYICFKMSLSKGTTWGAIGFSESRNGMSGENDVYTFEMHSESRSIVHNRYSKGNKKPSIDSQSKETFDYCCEGGLQCGVLLAVMSVAIHYFNIDKETANENEWGWGGAQRVGTSVFFISPAVFFLLIVLVLFGCLKNFIVGQPTDKSNPQDKGPNRKTFVMIYAILSISVIILGYVNIIDGMDLMYVDDSGKNILYCWFGLSSAIVSYLEYKKYFLEKYESKKSETPGLHTERDPPELLWIQALSFHFALSVALGVTAVVVVCTTE
eukprot:UC4_evm4s1447